MDTALFARTSMYKACEQQLDFEGNSGASPLADRKIKGDQAPFEKTTLSNIEKIERGVLCGNKRYNILGKGAAKTILEESATRVYLVANSVFKIGELREEFNLTKKIRKSIEFRVIVTEVKKRCYESLKFNEEEKKSIVDQLKKLSSIYAIDELKEFYDRGKDFAIKKIMSLTGASKIEADKIFYLLGCSSDSDWNLDSLEKKIKESQSNIALDLEELPKNFLGRYALSSSRAIGDLDRFLQREDLSFEDRYDLCCQVLTAVEQFHAAGFIHGDLKPDNFLIYQNEEGKYTVKLSDFGKTRKVDSKKAFLRWGNPRYIGPENRSSMAGEVYGAALICLKILEEPFLKEGESLILPSAMASSVVLSKENRRGIEKYLLNSRVTVQVEQKTILQKIIRALKIFFSRANFLGVEKEVHRYMKVLQEELRIKKEEGVSACLCFFPFLYDALSSDPSSRPLFTKEN